MKKVREKVLEIIKEYDLKPIELPEGHKNLYSYIRENPEKEKEFKPKITDSFLNKKYIKHIPRGWYGFDVGTPIVSDWMEIIYKITELCVNIDPNLEIHQVKLKWGRIDYYASSNIIEDIFDVDLILNNKLYDEALVY